jgi:predicted  nucleic acid-binding Zn-ribbon protein
MITLVGMCGGGRAIWIDKSRDIEDLQSWRLAHEQVHKEGLSQVKEKEGSYNTRLATIEQAADAGDRKIDNLAYRVTILEQNRDALTMAVKELQGAIQKLATNQEVSTEILQRLDQAINNRQGQ